MKSSVRYASPAAHVVISVFATLVALTGCRASSATIGPMGGTVRSGDGASVIIPAGALSTETQISLTAADRSTLPGGGVAGGRAYHLEPDGLVFAQPVSVQIPYDPQSLPAGTTATDLRLMTAPVGASGYAFEMVTAFSTSSTRPFLSALTYHFSDVWVAAVNSPSPGYRQNSTGLQGGATGASLVTFGSSATDIPRDICAEPGDVCACDHCGAGTLPCCGGGVCVNGVCGTSSADAGTDSGSTGGWACNEDFVGAAGCTCYQNVQPGPGMSSSCTATYRCCAMAAIGTPSEQCICNNPSSTFPSCQGWIDQNGFTNRVVAHCPP